MRIVVETFQIADTVNGDYLELTDSVGSVKWRGSKDNGYKYISIGNEVTLRFKTYARSRNNGFNLFYEAVTGNILIPNLLQVYIYIC